MKKHLLTLIIWGIVLICQSQSLMIEQCFYSRPVPLLMPVLTDSSNILGEHFDNKKLLNTRMDFDKVFMEKHIISIDNDSDFSIPATAVPSLHVLKFSLQSTNYQKGKLLIHTSDMMQVFSDEKKKIKEKLTLKSDSVNVAVTLQAGKNDFYIKFLCLNDSVKEHKIKIVYATEDKQNLPATQVSSTHYYNIHTLLDGKHIRSVSLSPNGKYALVNFFCRKDKSTMVNYVQLIDIDKQQVVLQDQSYLTSASWMPKSSLLHFSRQGLKGKEWVVLDPSTLKETVLDENLPNGNFVVCPDEQTLIFSLAEEGTKKEANFMQQILDPSDRQANGRKRYYLSLYNLKNGTLQRLTFGYQSVTLHDVHPQATCLLFSVSKWDYTQRPFSTTSLYELNWQTLQVDTLLQSASYFSSAAYSPDGKQLLVKGGPDAFDGIGRNIGREPIANAYDNQLFVFDLATRSAQTLTKYFNPSIVSAKWNKDNNQIYVLAEDKNCRHLFSLNPQTHEAEKLDVQEDYIKWFQMAQTAPLLLCLGQSACNADRLYIVNLKKQTAKCLLDLSAERLKDVALGQIYDWNFVHEKDTIYGYFCLPPDFDSSKTYPLLVYYYGGTSPTNKMLEFSYSPQLFAAQGYVVYTLNPSGSTGFGQEFSARHVNAWGKRTADEIIFGVKQFCNTHTFVDKEKIGCFGASYGGFMTQYLQTQTDIFAAAVSHAGISAISSYWGEGYWGIGYCSIANADTYPWNNPDFYVQQSPLFMADKIKTPLLLLHGTVDTNVPIGESIQMYNALKILGKTVEFIQVEGENHGISNYEKRMAWTNTMIAWFDKYLKNQPQLWNSLYPEKKY